MFEPFFTTKEQGKGSGLGLATVYGIVKQSGGYIWVYSEPGHGTVFKVYLPLTPASSVARLAEGGDSDHLDAIHLLITDVVMPHLSGRELADRLAPIRPTMKALFMSGYTDHSLRQDEVPTGAAFLQKPFTPEILARRVRHILDTEQVEG